MLKRLTHTAAAAGFAATALEGLAPASLVQTPSALVQPSETQVPVRLVFETRDAPGRVWFGVHATQRAWDRQDADYGGWREVEAGRALAEFELPAGEYAIVAFHDLDGDEDFDRNLIGIPAEPYGFSNGAAPRLRVARWEEARVVMAAEGFEETITLSGAFD